MASLTAPAVPTAPTAAGQPAPPATGADAGAAGDGGAPTPDARRDREALVSHVVVLLLIDIAPAALGWGLLRFVRGTRPLRRLPGLAFAKQLGSGHDGGFGLRPSTTRQGLFMVFDDGAAAASFIDGGALAADYRRHARELCVLLLRTCSCRGSWAGTRLALAALPPARGEPVAALTRASLRLKTAVDFWRHAPPAQASVEQAPGCRLAVGLGEAPLLRQATFTLWDSAAAMESYARSGAHLQAARAAQQGGHFSESMFARFVPVDVRGSWHGRRFG